MAEETVTKESATTTAPKTMVQHYEAAKVAQSSTEDHGADTETPDDTSSEAPPAEDPAKPADQPQEPGEESDTLLTEAELASLPPKERARAEKWQAKLTKKAQALSAKDKEFEPWKPLIDGFTQNAAATLEQVAKQLGFKVVKDQDTTAKTKEDEDDIPEELKFLKPVFDKREKRIEEKIRAEVAPIKERHEALLAEAVANESQSALKAFSSKYPGWEKHEAAMLKIGAKLMPSAEMDEGEYMEHLYFLATRDAAEADKTKKVVEKITKAAASSEQKTSGMSESRVEHVMPTGLTDSSSRMRAAAAAAKRGEVWVRPS